MSDDNTNTETTTTEETTTATTPNKPQQETFSREYVEALRGESKGSRLELKVAKESAKNIESMFKAFIGLKEDETLDKDKIDAYQAKILQANTDAVSTANNRLIQAEIKSLEGYDVKLVSKLLDRSEVKIADDGTITGITEALAKLEAEFPQVKTNTPGNPANPAPQGKNTDEEDNLMRRSLGLPPKR